MGNCHSENFELSSYSWDWKSVNNSVIATECSENGFHIQNGPRRDRNRIAKIFLRIALAMKFGYSPWAETRQKLIRLEVELECSNRRLRAKKSSIPWIIPIDYWLSFDSPYLAAECSDNLDFPVSDILSFGLINLHSERDWRGCQSHWGWW
jgi:hypothetical protein